MVYFNNQYPLKPLKLRNTVKHWAGIDNLENYRAYQPNPYNESSITYKYNEMGFRSDSFVNSNLRMIFMGCSFVEGIGLPLEETFTYRIYSAVKDKLGIDFPYWNLGLGGCGLDTLVRCYHNLYNQLKPQVVFALFPSYRLEYLDTFNIWHSAILNSPYGAHNIFENNLHLIEKNVITYSIEKNLAMLNLMIEKYNTTLIWDTTDVVNAPNVDYKKLSHLQNDVNSWLLLQNKIDSNFVFARDGMHYGKHFHREYADIVLDRYSDLICKRLLSSS